MSDILLPLEGLLGPGAFSVCNKGNRYSLSLAKEIIRNVSVLVYSWPVLCLYHLLFYLFVCMKNGNLRYTYFFLYRHKF